MKTITIIAEQISDRALTAVLPAAGVVSVAVCRAGSASPASVGPRAIGADTYRGFGAGNRFTANYRIEVVVDDDAVTAVFDGLDFAYGAGIFSDAEAWVSASELALSA